MDIGYTFKNEELLNLALTHPSLSKKTNNQRLEFLGDAVLGLIISEMLYLRFPDEPEGDIARRHSALVRGETLCQVASNLNLGDEIKMSNGEEQANGRNIASNLEDAVEAVIGALYLDGGLKAAKAFILSHWQALSENITAPPKDAKTALQEWAQARGLPIPSYTTIESTGPAHAPEFTVQVSLEGYEPLSTKAGTKRVAEQEAAKLMLVEVGDGKK
jgi:ribonuclease-3